MQLPWPQKQCDFVSITMVVLGYYLQMIWGFCVCEYDVPLAVSDA